MGVTEQIYVIRDGYPIAFLEYRVCLLTSILETMDVEVYQQEHRKDYVGKVTGETFERLLMEMKEKKGMQKGEESILAYIDEYFQKIELKASDNVFITLD
ncbi:MAG: hypothetical protein ACFFD1_02720 [Candidatus Thorarchaeota archaeon]